MRTANAPAGCTRIERDSLGELPVPEAAYYGVHTQRAVDNFAISGRSIATQAGLVKGLVTVKQSAALANAELGVLSPETADAIVAACVDIRQEMLDDQFVVDVFQGGAGTSANMNANEVVANRALEHLGRPRGDYEHCHPIDDVNRSQSTNDVYPTAVRLAILSDPLLEFELAKAADALRGVGKASGSAKKLGRTQLQDAVPMKVEDEWAAWASVLEAAGDSVGRARERLLDLNIGGTAIGSGLTAPAGFREACLAHLCDLTNLPLRSATNLFAATQDLAPFVEYSSALSTVALGLGKLCNDLRLLSSGPETGLAELRLPARQAGSSIMPGKVNPVIPEAVNQICFRVVSNDHLVTMAAGSGQLQLNAFLPAVSLAILESQQLLRRGASILRRLCIEGTEIDLARSSSFAESSTGRATELLPEIGYAGAAELAKQMREGRGDASMPGDLTPS